MNIGILIFIDFIILRYLNFYDETRGVSGIILRVDSLVIDGDDCLGKPWQEDYLTSNTSTRWFIV